MVMIKVILSVILLFTVIKKTLVFINVKIDINISVYKKN